MWTINKTFIKYVGPSSITDLGAEMLLSSDRIHRETGQACVHLCVLEVRLQWQGPQETLTYGGGHTDSDSALQPTGGLNIQWNLSTQTQLAQSPRRWWERRLEMGQSPAALSGKPTLSFSCVLNLSNTPSLPSSLCKLLSKYRRL